MSDHLDREPGGVGGEAARREVIEPHPVLEIADGVLDLGMAAMVGLEFESLAIAVGDEGVVVVEGEEGELGTRRRAYPADDEPEALRILLIREGDVASSRPRRRRPASSTGSASRRSRGWPRSAAARSAAGGS